MVSGVQKEEWAVRVSAVQPHKWSTDEHKESCGREAQRWGQKLCVWGMQLWVQNLKQHESAQKQGAWQEEEDGGGEEKGREGVGGGEEAEGEQWWQQDKGSSTISEFERSRGYITRDISCDFGAILLSIQKHLLQFIHTTQTALQSELGRFQDHLLFSWILRFNQIPLPQFYSLLTLPQGRIESQLKLIFLSTRVWENFCPQSVELLFHGSVTLAIEEQLKGVEHCGTLRNIRKGKSEGIAQCGLTIRKTMG